MEDGSGFDWNNVVRLTEVRSVRPLLDCYGFDVAHAPGCYRPEQLVPRQGSEEQVMYKAVLVSLFEMKACQSVENIEGFLLALEFSEFS